MRCSSKQRFPGNILTRLTPVKRELYWLGSTSSSRRTPPWKPKDGDLVLGFAGRKLRGWDGCQGKGKAMSRLFCKIPLNLRFRCGAQRRPAIPSCAYYKFAARRWIIWLWWQGHGLHLRKGIASCLWQECRMSVCRSLNGSIMRLVTRIIRLVNHGEDLKYWTGSPDASEIVCKSSTEIVA